MTECDHSNIDTCKLRQAAAAVIDDVCGLLDDKGIQVPSDDREGGAEESAIYGTEYYELEDTIVETLANYFPGQ